MPEIIFVKTRWYYQSYTDFWRLVELSGYPTCYVDEMDTDRDGVIYIICPMNGEVRPFMEMHSKRTSKVYMWNLERPGGSGSLAQYTADNKLHLRDRILDGILVSDRMLAEHTDFHYVPLGSHAGLGYPGQQKLGYSVIHLSCYSPHRDFMFYTPYMQKGHLGLYDVLDNGWDEERHNNLMRAVYMLNVHQDGFPYIEPLRFSLAAAYGLPILSETCYDIYPYQEVDRYVSQSDDVMTLLNDPHFGDESVYFEFHSAGLMMRKIMTSTMSFRACLEANLPW